MVAAIVVDRAAFDPAAVFAWCREKLEPNSVPSFLQVVDEIPKTASEKPQERFLIEALGRADAQVWEAAGSGAVRVASVARRTAAGA